MASYTSTTLALGTHNITAVYSGDSVNAAATSPVVSEVISPPLATTITVTSNANPAVTNQVVSFTPSITYGNPSFAPTGTVTFKDGSTTLGSVSPFNLFTTSTLAVGTHSITATYSGDTYNAPSTSSSLAEVITTVGTSSTTTSGSVSPNPAYLDQSVTINVAVTGKNPTGNVTLSVSPATQQGVTALGTYTLSSGSYQLFLSSSVWRLVSGTSTITAAYSGDSVNAPSTGTFAEVVSTLYYTTSQLTSSSNPSTAGQSITFSAAVTGLKAGAYPTGTVTFSDGGTVLGTSTLAAPVSNVSTATYTTSALAHGTHSITATYNGDTTNATSTSAPVSQVVN
jgi:hypothetical protein